MPHPFPQSQELFERASRVIAGGVNSGIRKLEQPVPLFFTHGKAGRLWDEDKRLDHRCLDLEPENRKALAKFTQGVCLRRLIPRGINNNKRHSGARKVRFTK